MRLLQQGFRWSAFGDAPGFQHGQPATQATHNVQIMRYHQQRPPRIAQCRQRSDELAAAVGVEAFGRLINHEHARRGAGGECREEALRHPAR